MRLFLTLVLALLMAFQRTVLGRTRRGRLEEGTLSGHRTTARRRCRAAMGGWMAASAGPAPRVSLGSAHRGSAAGFCIWQLCMAARSRWRSWAATQETLPGRHCRPAIPTPAPAGGPRTAGEAHAQPQGHVVPAFAPTRRPITAPPLFVPTNGEQAPCQAVGGPPAAVTDGPRGARWVLSPSAFAERSLRR